MADFARVFVIPLLVPVLVGIGASAVTSAVLIGRLEERVGHVESTSKRHEDRLDYLRARTEEQERQLARVGTLLESLLGNIDEMKADLKVLLRK